METCTTLSGCLLTPDSPIVGAWELLGAPDAKVLADLLQNPGVWYSSARSKKGWYIPASLVHQGKMPATLDRWYPDSIETTPIEGLRLDTYQRRTVSFLRTGGPGGEGALLAADAGTGKTICVLAALYRDGLLSNRGIICGQKKTGSAWMGEQKDPARYFGVHIEPLVGKKPDLGILHRHQILFVHYEILQYWWEDLFRHFPADWLIFDEIHLLSNPAAKQSIAAANLTMTGSVRKRIGLTGTPIQTSRMDLWNQLRLVQPQQWDSYHQTFGIRYCGGQRAAERDGGHWTYSEETNSEELAARLAGTLLRYEPQDIPENEIIFPKARRRVIKIEDLSQEWWSQYYSELKKTAAASLGPEELESLTKELGILSWAKIPYVLLEIIKMLGRHDRIVVLLSRKAPANKLHERLSGIAKIAKIAGKSVQVFGPATGAMPFEKRESLAEDFAAAPHGIYIATLGAVGLSLNFLDCATALIHGDLWWNVSDMIQGERRVLRRSNTASEVELVYFHIPKAVDDKIIQFLHRKAKSAHAVSSSDTEGLKLAEALGICAPAKRELSEILDHVRGIAHELGYQ